MDAPDHVVAVEIGEGTRDLEDAVIGAGGEAHLFGRLLQETLALPVGLRDAFDLGGRTMGIAGRAGQAEALVALRLQGMGGSDARHDVGRGFRRLRLDQVGGRHRRHVDADVDPVHQRAGDAGLVVGGAARAAGTAAAGFARHAASTGIHRGNELHLGRVGDPVIGPGDDAFAGLQRLAQGIQHDRREFGAFVEEEDAAMGERDLARPCPQAPPTIAAIEAE